LLEVTGGAIHCRPLRAQPILSHGLAFGFATSLL
jgi:hypothetical protein